MLLVREKILDDIHDENRRPFGPVLRWIDRKNRRANSVLESLGFRPLALEEAFRRQREIEAENSPELHDLASSTAEVMNYIYTHIAQLLGVPNLASAYGKIGRSLGTVIYVLDCITDYHHDFLSGAFNPLHRCSGQGGNVSAASPLTVRHQMEGPFNIALAAMRDALSELPITEYLQDLFVFGVLSRNPRKFRHAR